MAWTRVRGAAAIGLLAAGTLWGGVAVAQTTAPGTAALIAATDGNRQLVSSASYIGRLCPAVSASSLLGQHCTALLALGVSSPNLAEAALDALTPQEILAQSGMVDGAITSATAAVAGRLSALSRLGGPGGIARADGTVLLASAGDTAGLGGFSAPRLQAYVNLVGGHGSRDTNELEEGYDYDQNSLTVGADYRFSNRFTGGVSLSYGQSMLSFDENGGKMKIQPWVGSVYGLWTVDQHLQVSALISYGRVRFVGDRTISYVESATSVVNQLAHSDVHGDQWEGTVTVSYAMDAPQGWTYGPSLALSGQTLSLPAFAESGASWANLSYDAQHTDSLQVIGQFDVSKALSTELGVFSPYARLQAIYETLDDHRAVNVRFVADTTDLSQGIRLTTSDPERFRGALGLGVSAQLVGGWSAFVDGETVLGLRDVSGYTGTFGVRKEF